MITILTGQKPELEDLEHFGVMGQRWGVRKEKKLTARTEKREGKAKKFDEKADSFRTQLDTLNKRKTNILNRGSIRRQKKELNKQISIAVQDAEAKRQGKLSHKQKSIIKGAVAAGAIVAAVGAYRMAQSGSATASIQRGKAFITGNHEGFKRDMRFATPDLTPDAVHASVARGINPEFGAFGTKMNCRRCTFAYEMRRRGYDVTATRTTNARGQNLVGLHNALTPGTKDKVGPGKTSMTAHIIKESRLKEAPESSFTEMFTQGKFLGKNEIEPGGNGISHSIFDALSKEPAGARGELGVSWLGGGGHSVAWENFHGKPVLFDTQSGLKFSSAEEMMKTYGNNINLAQYTRLDNVPLDMNFLQRWMK